MEGHWLGVDRIHSKIIKVILISNMFACKEVEQFRHTNGG